MTICIAGICGENDNDSAVVLASDRMLTERGTLSVEFEPNQPKKIELTDKSLGLAAGSALVPSDVESRLREKDFSKDIDGIADEVRETVNKLSQKKLANDFLIPYGLDLSFLENPTDATIHARIFQRIQAAVNRGPLGIQLLIAGVDQQGAHIFLVRDPSHKQRFDNIGFHAIGSGTDHARGSLISNGFQQMEHTINEGTYLIYEAKKAAEISPGVGAEYTDMWIIDPKGVSKLDNDTLEKFEEIREKKVNENQNVLKNIFDEANDLNISGDT